MNVYEVRVTVPNGKTAVVTVVSDCRESIGEKILSRYHTTEYSVLSERALTSPEEIACAKRKQHDGYADLMGKKNNVGLALMIGLVGSHLGEASYAMSGSREYIDYGNVLQDTQVQYLLHDSEMEVQ